MYRNALRVGSALGVFLILLFAGESGYARGRGGRGGGRSISRSGPASRGSFGGGYSGGGSPELGGGRPSAGTLPAGRGGRGATGLDNRGAGTRPSAQPSTGDHSGLRQGAEPTGDRAANANQRADRQPAGTQGDRDQAREDWQQNQQQRQDERQQWADEAREDRQDAWDDALDDVDGVYYGHYGHVYDVDDYWAGAAVIVVGTVFTFAAFDVMARDTGCAISQVTVEGIEYYRCGSSWYTRVVQGGNPSYVVVKPPPGY